MDLNDQPYLMGWVVDVTPDYERGAAKSHAHRLESMALMASGIAHDFNNQLTTVMTYLSLVERGSRPNWPKFINWPPKRSTRRANSPCAS